jgi:hypothetical protein
MTKYYYNTRNSFIYKVTETEVSISELNKIHWSASCFNVTDRMILPLFILLQAKDESEIQTAFLLMEL